MYRGAKGVRVCSNTTTKGGWQPHLLSKVVAYVIERRRGHEATRRVGAEPPRVRVRLRVEVRVSVEVGFGLELGPGHLWPSTKRVRLVCVENIAWKG